MFTGIFRSTFSAVLLLLAALILPCAAQAQFAGGDGSRANPWRIATPQQLAGIGMHLDAHFILVANLDLGGADPAGPFWNGGEGWLPIGFRIENGALRVNDFVGSFDGAGHEIRNLYMNRTTSIHVYYGLFWRNFGDIRNLELSNVSITAIGRAGAIVGESYGVLHNVHASGRITSPGNASLLAAAVGGALSGTPERPLLLENTQIGELSLQDVIVGGGNIVFGDVKFGTGARVQSQELVHSLMDFSSGLPQIPWPPYPGLTALGLDADILVVPDGKTERTILSGMQALPEYLAPGNDVTQNPATGELTLHLSDYVAKLLPIHVLQEHMDGVFETRGPGTHIARNGDIEFITATGRRIVSWPLVLDLPFFSEQLARAGLGLGGDTEGNFKVTRTDSASYYLARPYVARAAATGSSQGLTVRPAPGIPNINDYVLVFRAADGRLMEQLLVPRAVDWMQLSGGIYASVGADEVSIDAQGIIRARRGQRVMRARVSYDVVATGQPGPPFVQITPTSDLNGDGITDYALDYANGDRQWLYLYPDSDFF